jgi:predicted CXXCH cytochrome family protein
MKRFSIILTLAVALVVTGASMVFAAALGNNLHGSFTGYTTNQCKICHDTAKGTPALRGWAGAGAGPTGGWGGRPISALCYMCHESGGGGFTPAGHNMTQYAYATGAHQFTIANDPEQPEGSNNTAISTTGLPYVATTALECTSCHNVHVSTYRPFMQRSSYQALCNACHPGRLNNTPVRHAANQQTGGSRNYSTHPTNVAVGDVGNVNVKTVANMHADLKVAFAAAPGYSLGGHLASGATGNMDCMTCHAVHGVWGNTASVGNQDLLAVDNQTVAGQSDPSALCEGCHYGGNTGEQVGTLTAGGAVEYSDHPIDSINGRAFYPAGVAIPTNWTNASTPNNDRGAQPFYEDGATDTPVCSSCHDTHGGIPSTSMLRGPSQTGTEWTMTYGTWCFVCHTNAQVIPNNHHSVLQNWGSSNLQCGDCHGVTGQTDWRAHNGFWAFAVALSSTNSNYCTACHNVNDPTAWTGATGLKGQSTAGWLVGEFPARHGTYRNAGVGSSHQSDGNDGDLSTSNLLIKTTAWADSGATSEWGPANQVICESCHDILSNGISTARGLSRGWQANLLLEVYEDDTSGEAAGEINDNYTSSAFGAGRTDDALCRGCHTYTGSPASFVHNPEAHTVLSYTYPATARPYGRTTNTILTDETAACPDKTTADMASSPGNCSYPAANQVDCDSCHRPHNADSDSRGATTRYRILEVTDTNWGTTICAECHDTDVQCNQ